MNTQSQNTGQTKRQGEAMRNSEAFAYIGPSICITLMIASMGIVHNMYAKYFGIGLTTIAAILLFSRIFDVFTDPLMGVLSDRYRARTGTRKPIVVLGALLLILSSYFIFIPAGFSPMTAFDPTNTSSIEVSPTYFLIALFLFYAAYTIFEIPHMAWASEIARSAEEKNRIFTLRSAANSLGILLFLVVPFLPIFETRDITPQTLQWTFMLGVGLLLPMLYLCVIRVGNGHYSDHAQAKQNAEASRSSRIQALREFIKIILANKPFLLFLLAAFATFMGLTMMIAVQFFYIDGYLRLGSDFALIAGVSHVVSLLFMWVWYKVFTRWGKRNSWILLCICAVVALLAYTRLAPGEDNLMPVMLMKALISVVFGGLIALMPAQLSHVIDYDAMKHGKERAATFYSIYGLVLKAAGALANALALAVAGWLGFDPAASIQSEGGVLGLHMAMAYGPTAWLLLAIVFIYLNPINEQRHRIIVSRLEARAARC